MFELGHFVWYSLNYSDVITADVLISFVYWKPHFPHYISWLSKYDIRVKFLRLKIFLVPQYRHIINPFEDAALMPFGVIFIELSRAKTDDIKI